LPDVSPNGPFSIVQANDALPSVDQKALDTLTRTCDNGLDTESTRRIRSMMSREEVLQQALSLPPSDQAFVADMLERQIAEAHELPAEFGAAWAGELDKRIASYDRKETARLGFAESLNLLGQSIAGHRSARDAK
jgi:hypothetical protein